MRERRYWSFVVFVYIWPLGAALSPKVLVVINTGISIKDALRTSELPNFRTRLILDPKCLNLNCKINKRLHFFKYVNYIDCPVTNHVTKALEARALVPMNLWKTAIVELGFTVPDHTPTVSWGLFHLSFRCFQIITNIFFQRTSIL